MNMIHKNERKFTWDVTQLRPLSFSHSRDMRLFFYFLCHPLLGSSFLIGAGLCCFCTECLSLSVKENVINGTWMSGWIACDFDDTTKHFHKSKNISKSEHAEWQIVVIHCLLLQTEKHTHTHMAMELLCACAVDISVDWKLSNCTRFCDQNDSSIVWWVSALMKNHNGNAT